MSLVGRLNWRPLPIEMTIFCYWPEADVIIASLNVRFWGVEMG
jgi:hypothetical protein